ncbi:c-type cytochrome [Pollutimonas sp. M17]|uniref:c-type cytochrome n=1 Tax=Pollutimonas sp. M17 TaxID=2962065 RepID=UPI0021F4DA45|nr:cytochrome c [Pollutimonas sp. M17]UYO95410.1 cytochrome c [Pollutimonas sp. M17]
MRASKPVLKRMAGGLAGLLLLVPAARSTAADVAAGRAKAAQCAVCHGANGIATLPDAPNLAGQSEIYLAKALRDFKSGARKNEMMTMMAAGLSDADIENLAAYYQSIEITVKQP